MKSLHKSILAAGIAACLTVPVLATDKVVLKDGREFVGEIVSQTENVVQIKVTHGEYVKTMTFWVGDIVTIARDIPAEEGTEEVETSDSTTQVSGGASVEGEASARSAYPPILLLPLTGMVGVEFRAEEIKKAVERADEIEKETGTSPIIVLEIESGGGAMTEMYAIAETLRDVKKSHRVVAWIKEAISAACATALHCDEIYFRTEGNAGAMTGFNGATGIALQDEALLMWLHDASDWAEGGGRFGGIARAMIDEVALLSYDKDPVTGEVTWYDDLSGEYKLSDEKENLVFTANQAVHCGFADGIADTTAELAKLLDLPKWVEVEDRYGREVHEEWIGTVEMARQEIPRIYGRLQIVQGSGAADPLEKIGRTIALLEQLIRWWDKAPNVATYEVPIPPKELLELQIAELRKQAGDIRKARQRG